MFVFGVFLILLNSACLVGNLFVKNYWLIPLNIAGIILCLHVLLTRL